MSDRNRVDDYLRNWERMNPKPVFEPEDYRDRRLGMLERIKMAFKDADNFLEKQSLLRIDAEIQRTLQLLKPDILLRVGLAFDNLLKRIVVAIGVLLKLEEPFLKLHTFNPYYVPVGLSMTKREQKEEAIQKLSHTLQAQGLPGRIKDQTAARIFFDEPSFTLSDTANINGQVAKIETYVQKAEGSGRYYPTGYDLTTFRGLALEKEEVVGINIRDLDKWMRDISWQTDYSTGAVAASKNPAEGRRTLEAVNGIFSDLNRLLASGDPVARKIHDQLTVSYFLDTPNAVLVPNMEEIKKQFEHKIHIDLSPTSIYPLRPTEAMQLLNRRPIYMAPNANGQAQAWLGIDFLQEDARGFYQIRPVEGSERFNLHSALAQVQVTAFPDFRSEKEAITALQRGESVKAEVLQDGRLVQRYIQADPDRQRITTDWIRSEKEGLLQRDAQLLSNLDQYLGRQRGDYAAPVVVQSPDIGTTKKVAVQQPGFWKVEEERKVEINNSNLASLEKQMVGMGVRAGVAKEALEMAAKSEDPQLQVPYKQQYGEDMALAQLRFRKDPDTEWVHFSGYDMKVSLGEAKKEVNQRYYYNPEDPINNYSLEEAYRMAAGNAVSRMVGGGDQTQEVWRSLGLDQKLSPKGNHLIISTPFDLEKAMLEYPHKNELIKYLAPGHSIDNILSRARKGEDVHFSINKNGILEVMNLKVNLRENNITVVRSADPPKEGLSQQQTVGNKNGKAQGATENERIEVRRNLTV